MATTFQTGFEDYADGDSTSIAHGSVHDHGWRLAHDPLLGYDIVTVVSSVAHSGSKSVAMGSKLAPADPGPVVRTTVMSRTMTASPSGRCGQVEGWGLSADFNWEDAPSVQVGLLVGMGRSADGLGQVIAGLTNPTLFTVSTVDSVLASTTVPVQADWHKVRIEVTLSTVNAAGTAFNADGAVKAFLNDVLIHDLSGLTLHFDTDPADGIAPVTDSYYSVEGYLDDVVQSDDESSPEIPPNDTNPCCGDRIDPTGIDGVPGPTPLQPWTRRCAGGGDVPTASDLVDDEVWAL